MTELEHMAPEERRRVYLEVSAKLLVPAALIILAVVMATAWFLYDTARDRSRENRVLIERIQATERQQKEDERRDDRRDRRVDIAICREVNSIKERIRATVKVSSRAEFMVRIRALSPSISVAQIDALYKQSKAQELEVRERFAASDCTAVPRG